MRKPKLVKNADLLNRWEKEGCVYCIGCDDELSMSCLLTNRSCVFENQNTLSSEAIMSVLTRVGDYELLEKRNEGYETN